MIERISHYRIVVRIGRGAMGEVYHAIDERLGRPVALKLLPASISDSAESQARLLREAQAASALNHPGIVTVHDVGAWEGRVFMVMELVDGERFTEVARAGIALGDSLALAAQVADALGVAHARSIFHRDVKSDNLMRTRDGRAKVLDFGLAKLLDSITSGAQTTIVSGESPRLDVSEAHASTIAPTSPAGPQTAIAEQLESSERARSSPSSGGSAPSETIAGSLLGTPAYMSPEQADGATVDAVSEVFSLGVVLYELVTGVRPFDGDSIESTLQALRRGAIVPPSRRAPARKIPAFVDALVLRALERDRSRRFADMPVFAAAMRAARARLGARRASPYLVAGGLLTLVAIGGAMLFRPMRNAHPARPKPKITTVRRITFDSGCEEYPSFSRDGKTILYDGLVDDDYELFTLDLGSGAKTRITHSPGWDWGAALAPDGHSIAWLRSLEPNQVAVVGDLKEAPSRVLGPASGVPTWMPDGSLLFSPEGAELDRISMPSGSKSVFGSLGANNDLDQAVAFDDGRVLATWSEQHTALVVGVFDVEQRLQRMAENHTGGPIGIAVAASQRAFYYTRNGGNANELIRHSLDDDHEVSVPGGSTPVSFALARDGKHLAYSTCSDSERIARAEPDGRTADVIASGTSHDTTANVLADGRIVFASDRAGLTQVWLFDPRAHDYQPLTDHESHSPTVSRDARLFAYVDVKEAGVFVAPIAGGTPRRLTDVRTDDHLAFSNDGHTVVFERDGHQIWAVPVDGGSARALSAVGGIYPATSPNDDTVMYLQPDGTRTRLMATTITGAAPRALDVMLPKGNLGSLTFSPDGKRVAFARTTQEVFELSLAPGSEPRSRWKAHADALKHVAYDGDGRGLLLSLVRWEGDLWLAEGDFP